MALKKKMIEKEIAVCDTCGHEEHYEIYKCFLCAKHICEKCKKEIDIERLIASHPFILMGDGILWHIPNPSQIVIHETPKYHSFPSKSILCSTCHQSYLEFTRGKLLSLNQDYENNIWKLYQEWKEKSEST